MKHFLSSLTIASLLGLSNYAVSAKVEVTASGNYVGKVLLIKNCDLGMDDRRICQEITAELGAGKVVRGEAWGGATPIYDKSGRVIHHHNISRSTIDMANSFYSAIEKIRGKNVSLDVSCGDMGCGIDLIRISSMPKTDTAPSDFLDIEYTRIKSEKYREIMQVQVPQRYNLLENSTVNRIYREAVKKSSCGDKDNPGEIELCAFIEILIYQNKELAIRAVAGNMLTMTFEEAANRAQRDEQHYLRKKIQLQRMCDQIESLETTHSVHYWLWNGGSLNATSLSANPFIFKDKKIVFFGEFIKMVSPTIGVFSIGRQRVILSDVPTDQFSLPGNAIVIAKVLGRESDIPHLKFLGVHTCKQSYCEEIYSDEIMSIRHNEEKWSLCVGQGEYPRIN